MNKGTLHDSVRCNGAAESWRASSQAKNAGLCYKKARKTQIRGMDMLAEMCVFGVQIYPAKNRPMVILVKTSNNPIVNSKIHDRKNALAVSTGIMEILTIAFLINPDNKNNELVKQFTGSFHEFVGKNITKIEIITEGDGDHVGVIYSTRDDEKHSLKIRASDAICLSLVFNMPIYTKRKNLKILDEIYKDPV